MRKSLLDLLYVCRQRSLRVVGSRLVLVWASLALFLLSMVALTPAMSAELVADLPANLPANLSDGQAFLPAAAPADVEGRVSNLLGQMTLDEKIKMLSGTQDEMHTPGIERLKIPQLKFSDGPLGVRCWGKSTAYPCGAMLAASWDVGLAHELGTALGRDSRARGVHVLLGPGVDLYRVAQCGRNFEYFGEDPYLSAQMAVGWIKGVQEQGVATSVKHYAANDQEILRDSINTIVDERRLHEICFPPFKAAVQDAGAWTVMAAYNKVNGPWCTANSYLLTDVLRKQWGFKGILMSDWGAVHECLGPITAGCDLEMGKCIYYTPETVKRLLKEGKVSQAQIDEHVRRILRMSVALGFLDHNQEDKNIPANDPTSVAVALKEAREGLVLLKNEGDFLPLARAKVKHIVVLGPNASPAVTGGGGSSEITPFEKVSVLDAVTSLAGKEIKISHVPFVKGKSSELSAEQLKEITNADAVIAAVGFNQSIECEGGDRPFDLPVEQVELIKKVSAINPKVVVVLNGGGNVGMEPWIDSTRALIHAWYPGQNGNTAVAEALFGDLNPSGRLPDTFEKKWEDSPAYGNYPGDALNGGTVKYAEGIYVGYRGFDKKQIDPRFPFGYGLSYTKFAMANMKIANNGSTYDVAVDVTNSDSQRAGAAVVQLYVRPLESAIDRPVQELKGFRRVELMAGETKTVTIPLNSAAFAYYDIDKHDWVSPPGQYEIDLGQSSREKNCSQTITLK
jgi:beta-glucosidase